MLKAAVIFVVLLHALALVSGQSDPATAQTSDASAAASAPATTTTAPPPPPVAAAATLRRACVANCSAVPPEVAAVCESAAKDACSGYALVKERLCQRTCEAVTGQLCSDKVGPR